MGPNSENRNRSILRRVCLVTEVVAHILHRVAVTSCSVNENMDLYITDEMNSKVCGEYFLL